MNSSAGPLEESFDRVQILRTDVAYIFDFGRVLADFDINIALRQLCSSSSRGLDFQSMNDILFGEHRNMYIEFELGRIEPEQFHKNVCDIFDLQISFEEFKDMWGSIFTENKAIAEFLEKIKGVPKAILSNIDPIHWEVAKSLSVVKDHFRGDECIVSFEAGARKPDQAIYARIAGMIPPYCKNIYYFDDLEENIRAGCAAGLDGKMYDCRTDSVASLMQYL